MSRIVVALGGNALGNNPVEQLALVKETAKPLVDLIEEGHELIIAHGNGPQGGMINFNKPNQKALETMTIAEAEQYIAEGHFAPGSMLPKVQAAMAFVKSGDNHQAIIASLEKAALALKGESGTKIIK